jgi:hypothetical protein
LFVSRVCGNSVKVLGVSSLLVVEMEWFCSQLLSDGTTGTLETASKLLSTLNS